MQQIRTLMERARDRLPLEKLAGTSQQGPKKFGTFEGVFMPTLLTILGAIMYLREGWVVGNAGLGGALLVIFLANTITVCTGLSIASVATNIRVQAGGAFSIISQSLGLEVGGSISVPLYFAQAISVTLYIFAFSEGWIRIFPGHADYEWLVVFLAFAVVFAIAYTSAGLAARIQYLIFAIIGLSLFSIVLGSLTIPSTEILWWTVEQPGMIYEPVWWGDFPDGGFWVIFAVFFPAVTGILAGVSMSGALEDSRKSIPSGTMAAIGISAVIYLSLAWWLARVASPDELVNNLTVMVDKAMFGPLVLAGILGGTFSSALSSLVAGPRVLQALSIHGVVPRGDILSRETTNGEPRAALLVTTVIILCAMVFALAGGGLNAVAPLMTMFFLIAYAMLNGVVLIEQSLQLVSFRPLFRIPIIVPLIGLLGCVFVMFIVNPPFSLVALIVITGLYFYLTRQRLSAPWGDIRSGLFITLAEWAAKRISNISDVPPERTWKPSIVIPVQSPSELVGSYLFLKSLTYPRGSIKILGVYPPGQRERLKELKALGRELSADGVFTRVTLIDTNDFNEGLHIGLDVLHGTFFRPNILFITITEQTTNDALAALIQSARDVEMGTLLYARHPVTALGRQKTINVWIREQSPDWRISLRMTNLDLAVLLGYQLCRNWQGNINLITTINDENEHENAQKFLDQLIQLGRMPEGTRAHVGSGSLYDYLPNAPRADLHIFGIPPANQVEFTRQMLEATGSACIFVLDSGYESALA